MATTLAGHVIDTDDFEIEVWVCDDPHYVVLRYETSQLGDFPFGEPPNDPVSKTAQRVAEGEAKRLAVFVEEDEVIDHEDTKQMLREWQGDGKKH